MPWLNKRRALLPCCCQVWMAEISRNLCQLVMFSSKIELIFKALWVALPPHIKKKIDATSWLFPTLRNHHGATGQSCLHILLTIQFSFALTLSIWSTNHIHFYDASAIYTLYMGEVYTFPLHPEQLLSKTEQRVGVCKSLLCCFSHFSRSSLF